MKSKIRYSFPGKIYEMLLTDNKFYQEICKIKKVESSFPKYDQWKDEKGFHMSFALAGYAPEDISITIEGRQIMISANGLEAIVEPEEEEIDDVIVDITDETVNKVAKPNVHKGYISRGIARRPFKTSIYVSEEFDLVNVEANMEFGLLHVFIPEINVEKIDIKINKGE